MRERKFDIRKYVVLAIIIAFTIGFSMSSFADLMPFLKVEKLNYKGHITPTSNVWSKVPYMTVPLNIQMYSIKKVKVQAVISDGYMYIRLVWFDPTKNDQINGADQFYDGCAVSFPIKKVKGYAPNICMGQVGNEVNIWHWRANMKDHLAANLIAGGIGTLTEDKDPNLHQDAVWRNGRWYVEFYKPLKDDKSVVFRSGNKYYMAIAIWNGSDHERAMMKSVSNWFKVKIQ